MEEEISNEDPDVRKCLSTSSQVSTEMVHRLERFSDFESAIRGVAALQRFLSRSKPSVELKVKARNTIIRWVQREAFPEYTTLQQDGRISKSSPIRKLDPFVDKEGVLRVGGRIRASDVYYDEAHPLILPRNAHVSDLIVKLCHEKSMHQGKGITMQELRAQGYHIGASTTVAKHINVCHQTPSGLAGVGST